MSTYSFYTDITELPGDSLTQDQQERLYQRYHLAKGHAEGQSVLEIACGSGLGLSFVQKSARMLVGGDYTYEVLDIAHNSTRRSVPLVCFDAQHLPFIDSWFDFAFCFEAINYYADIRAFLKESHRILKPEGKLLIGTGNKEWSHFIPGSLSVEYYSISELKLLLTECGFTNIQFQGGFASEGYTLEQRIIASLRHFVLSTFLGSGLMAIREQLKPWIYRNTQQLKEHVWDGMAELRPLDTLSEETANEKYKVIFALATKPKSNSKHSDTIGQP